MVHRVRLWRALFLAAMGGVVCTFLGIFHAGKTAKAQPSGNSAGGPRPGGDPHWLPCPIPGDTDGDLLLDLEEQALGLLDFRDPDQNKNRVIDGPEVAWLMDATIGQLPTWKPGDPPPTEIVKIDYAMLGLETCEVCGASINMGFVEIYNPWHGRRIDLHYISLHYLHHGSFVYDGSLNEGRIDVSRLARVLEDFHQLAVAADRDGDLLLNTEEQAIGFDPTDPDEDGDLSSDGQDLALELRDKIAKLPLGPLPDQVYKQEYYAFGLENCEICGETHNMGFVQVTDPVKGLSVSFPFIGLHYMEHGSFSYDGTEHDGRVDLPSLYEILKDA